MEKNWREIIFNLTLTKEERIQLASEYLMKAVEEDENIFVRHEAILALATLGKKEFIPFIKKYLNSPELEIAESAEIALQRLEQT